MITIYLYQKGYTPEEFKKNQFKEFVIVVDIGGTNTTLAVMGISDEKTFKIIFSSKYKSKEVDSFYSCVNEVLAHANEAYDIQIEKGCFDIAGPTETDRSSAQATNLPLELSVTELKEKTMLQQILLLNDLEAIGFGIPLLNKLDDSELIELHHTDGTLPSAAESAPKVIVAPGTGLGIGIVFFNREKGLYIPSPSEGSHTDFSAVTDLEWKLVSYLKEHVTDNKHPDWERVLSGPGLANIYAFLRHTGFEEETEVIKNIEKLDERDWPQAIQQQAHHSKTCAKAIEMFIDLFARRARNLTLDIMARGGVYLAGGIAPKMVDVLQKPHFMKRFKENDRMGPILRKVPVYIVIDYQINLFGCCNAAVNHMDLAFKR